MKSTSSSSGKGGKQQQQEELVIVLDEKLPEGALDKYFEGDESDEGSQSQGGKVTNKKIKVSWKEAWQW